MIAKQRHHIILTLLETKDYLSIQEVATATASSEATARRDLLKLEADGQLERLHGGVTKVQSKHLSESSLQLKTQQAVDEKGRVAQYVAEHYLKAESVIFLDAGSATAALIPYLQAKNITVVTNGIHHIPKLLENNVKTIIVGGSIKPKTQAVIGFQTLQQLQGYSFDTCFIGVNAIDETFGCSTPDEAEAAIKQTAMQQSDEVVILADASKFNQRSFSQICELERYPIITDACPENFKNYQRIEVINE